MGFGRNGDLVAKTPILLFPPSRGGRTVGDHSSRIASENSHKSQIWENSSRPRSASVFLNSGSKMISPFNSLISPLWRGIPNFVGKSVWIRAITRNFGSVFFIMVSLMILLSHYRFSFARIASPVSEVEAVPPRSGVSTFPSSSTSSIASSTFFPQSSCPKKSSI